MENGVLNKTLKVLLGAYLLSLSALTHSESYQTTKTWFGDPDLQGIWTNSTLTTLERPDNFKALQVNKNEARRASVIASKGSDEYDNFLKEGETPKAGVDVGGYNTAWMDPGTELIKINGVYRSSIIISPKNGKLPWDQKKRRQYFAKDYRRGFKRTDHPELRGVGERCIVGFGSSAGPPMMNVLYNNNYQIVQSPGYVMIMAEMIHDSRIIRLEGSHLPELIDPWMGDSIGRWEGDTLVVETRNFNYQHIHRAALRHYFAISKDAKVTELFKRISDTEIMYRFSVDDPDLYKSSWQGEMPLRLQKDRIYEYACHEGNYAMANILAGAREKEK